jgi:hypothetical protein
MDLATRLRPPHELPLGVTDVEQLGRVVGGHARTIVEA